MMDENKLKISLGLTILPLLPILFFYNQLPSKMGIAFASDGTANGLVPKFIATFGVVFIFVLLELYHNAKYKNQIALEFYRFWCIPLASNFVVIIILSIYLKNGNVNRANIISIGTGMVFIALSLLIYFTDLKFIKTKKESSMTPRSRKVVALLYLTYGIIALLLKPNIIFSLIAMLVILLIPRLLSLLAKQKA